MSHSVRGVDHKYYPVDSAGNILINDPNSFETVQEIVDYLDRATGTPITKYAAVPLIEFGLAG